MTEKDFALYANMRIDRLTSAIKELGEIEKGYMHIYQYPMYNENGRRGEL